MAIVVVGNRTGKRGYRAPVVIVLLVKGIKPLRFVVNAVVINRAGKGNVSHAVKADSGEVNITLGSDTSGGGGQYCLQRECNSCCDTRCNLKGNPNLWDRDSFCATVDLIISVRHQFQVFVRHLT